VDGWRTVVMIQCVGSRSEQNPACSKICCQGAIKNALRLLARRPDLRLFVLYRDVRTPGAEEDAYLEARRRGALFVRYDPERPPKVETGPEGLAVTFHELLLDEELRVAPDALILSTGLVADEEGAEDLAGIFHLARTEDGFFLEDHVKLRPVDLPNPGFFVAGTAHGPKSIRESVTQAQAVAARAEALLAQPLQLRLGPTARVDSTRCAACLVCVRACPYGVPFVNAEGYSQIDPVRCHGCGVCAAECPAKAIQLLQYEDDQLSARIVALFERRSA
jgi:heterodisulfide reductase subunit A